jgi:hypothetical protein
MGIISKNIKRKWEIEVQSTFNRKVDYHYYEPKVYDMGRYFGGFNLRQLKRLIYGINEFAMSYYAFYGLIQNRIKNKSVTEHEKETLELFKTISNDFLIIREQFNNLQSDSPSKYSYGGDTFGRYYSKKYETSCRIHKHTDELEKITYAKTDPKNSYRTISYIPNDHDHIISLWNTLNSFYRFTGHWFGYFGECIFESENISIDLGLYMETLSKCKDLYIKVKMVDGLSDQIFATYKE